MDRHSRDRFIVPKEEFMRLNRKSGDGGEIIPTKRKYTRRSEVHQPFKVRILPPSQKRGRRSTRGNTLGGARFISPSRFAFCRPARR